MRAYLSFSTASFAICFAVGWHAQSLRWAWQASLSAWPAVTLYSVERWTRHVWPRREGDRCGASIPSLSILRGAGLTRCVTEPRRRRYAFGNLDECCRRAGIQRSGVWISESLRPDGYGPG